MAFQGVRNIINNRDNAAVNQFEIVTNKATYFQSYNSVVAKIDRNGKVILSSYWDYSNTTMKHLYIFLRDHNKEHLLHNWSNRSKADSIRKAIANKVVGYRKESSLKVI